MPNLFAIYPIILANYLIPFFSLNLHHLLTISFSASTFNFPPSLKQSENNFSLSNSIFTINTYICFYSAFLPIALNKLSTNLVLLLTWRTSEVSSLAVKMLKTLSLYMLNIYSWKKQAQAEWTEGREEVEMEVWRGQKTDRMCFIFHCRSLAWTMSEIPVADYKNTVPQALPLASF